MPKISVVIAAGDHPVLGNVMEAYTRQTLAPKDFEVIVVDPTHLDDWGPALEKTRALAPPDFSIRFETIDRAGRSSANNLGIRLATSEVIAFIASDFVPEPGMLEAHLRYHRDFPEAEAVAIGPGLFPDHIKSMPFPFWLEQSGELFGVQFTDEKLEVPEGYFYVGNASVKRSFLEQAGPFDEDFPDHAWDDYEMSLRLQRLGMHARYVPEAVAFHEHEVSYDERLESVQMAGNAAVILDSKLGGTQPWHALSATPAWRYRWETLKARCLYTVTRQRRDLHRLYKCSMNAAFAQAYRKSRSTA